MNTKDKSMNSMELAREKQEYLITLRRHFHRHPELSWQEKTTKIKICTELNRLGIAYEEVCSTGVVATIGQGKPVIGLRADMDALPIREKTSAANAEYVSVTPGVMHACGHDGHIAILLGVAAILAENPALVKGTIKLIFQPAEECIEGARKMSAEPVLQELDNVAAVHVWNALDIGKISVEEGPRMASADTFRIVVKGKSGHGSMPDQTVDAVYIGAKVVDALQGIVSRQINPLAPAVISVCSFLAGNTFNILPEQAVLLGTVRCFTPELRRFIPQAMECIIKGITTAYGARYDFEFFTGTPPTINETSSSTTAAECVKAILGNAACVTLEKTTGGEDFAYYLENVPGMLAFVGSRNTETEKTAPHHNECFDIDERSLIYGTAFFLEYIKRTSARLKLKTIE